MTEVAMTIERLDSGEWMLTIERGNAANVHVVLLSDMERQQLAALLDNGGSTHVHVTFQDFT